MAKGDFPKAGHIIAEEHEGKIVAPRDGLTESLTRQAELYMARCMAMGSPYSDQEQNWILGHLVTFALKAKA